MAMFACAGRRRHLDFRELHGGSHKKRALDVVGGLVLRVMRTGARLHCEAADGVLRRNVTGGLDFNQVQSVFGLVDDAMRPVSFHYLNLIIIHRRGIDIASPGKIELVAAERKYEKVVVVPVKGGFSSRGEVD